MSWGAELFADFIDFHVGGVARWVGEFDPCSRVWSKTTHEIANGFGCRVEVDTASVFEDFWSSLEFAVGLWY